MEEQRMQAMPEAAGEISAEELMNPPQEEEGLEMDEEPESGDAAQGAMNEAIGEFRGAMERLMEDGWTIDELRAMAADQDVLGALAQGETLGRAATAYLRRGTQKAQRKRGVPTFKSAATAELNTGDPIAQMSDAEFAAFSRRAKEAALAGLKVRL